MSVSPTEATSKDNGDVVSNVASERQIDQIETADAELKKW